MDLELRGKVALVTGSSRGIGRSIALGLAAEGCDVALVARGEEKLRETGRGIVATGVRTAAIVADVTVADDVARMVREAIEQLGHIDILVNNAGGSFPDDDAGWENAFRANIE